jgi:uncharacterized protein YjbI with pentapeptide repeats
MANPEHVAVFEQGIKAWNKWRKGHPEIEPDLRKAELSEAQCIGANFHRTNLSGANLRRAILSSVRLSDADLSDACLSYTDLGRTDFSGADLCNANLCHTNLSGANFREADLTDTNFSHAILRETMFINVDLSMVKGHDTLYHLGPSAISLDTVQRSRGRISKIFLRGTGVPEIFLDYIQTQGNAPFDYPTCFISFSSKDCDFVEQLYSDLQRAGVRCWFAPESLQTGEKFKASIDNAIRRYEKFLVVLSKHALKSGWVQHELEVALQKEHHGKPSVIYPLRLDGAITNSQTGWAAHIQSNRNMRSFENWQQNAVYHKAFKQLLCDLKNAK